MKKNIKRILSFLMVLSMLFSFAACGESPSPSPDPVHDGEIREDGYYYSAEDVSAYIIKFGKIPVNFITKDEAKQLGWTGGSVEEYLEGAAIGGMPYQNNEKLLPQKAGREYFYCDIDTNGKSSRGSKRLVYSNDGLIYYTEDSYKSFTLLYGDPEIDVPNDPSGDDDPVDPSSGDIQEGDIKIKEDGKYYDKEHVALYIHAFGKLPSNYVTKNQAKNKGWNGGSVEKYIEDAAIGGDKFGNNEGLLPKKSGRQYFECDIDTKGQKSRGAKRIIFSNDGLVYYTDDHYESFTLLYGEE